MFSGPLFLKPSAAAVFLPFLQMHFPHLATTYRERYKDRAFLAPAYGKRLGKLVSSLRQKYGLAERRAAQFPVQEAVVESETQMGLFG